MKSLKIMEIVIICLITLTFFPVLGVSQETYKFERMWPTLQQPWYFLQPEGIAVDGNGKVYIADYGNNRIQVFTSDGNFLTKWGREGSGDGEFKEPTAIAADLDGNIYVVDSKNDRIQKFSSDGKFISKWENCISLWDGWDEGFNNPGGIAVDADGDVYVSDSLNHRIRKFSPDGENISNWGSYGFGDENFIYPTGIVADRAGNIYVADFGNCRIQKFSSDGEFITNWGSCGNLDGMFIYPTDVAVDRSGNIYVADTFNDRIQKFSPDGTFLAKWGTYGSGSGAAFFNFPAGIAVSENGNIYVTDAGNSRIQKLGPDGNFITSWAAYGYFHWNFNKPLAATVSKSGYVYMADTAHRILKATIDGEIVTEWGRYGSGDLDYFGYLEMTVDENENIYVSASHDHRVQKLNSDGEILKEWGSEGSEDGNFFLPGGITVAKDGNIYVSDSGNNRIQVFNSDGTFIKKMGSYGTGPGEFDWPEGITTDTFGNIYVADAGNNRIQKFTPDGTFIAQWGSEGEGDGEFIYPTGISVDKDGYIYIADSGNNRIQKLSPDGQFITKFGEFGYDPSLLNGPHYVHVTADGHIFVVEYGNLRLQMFKEVQLTEGTTKAVIVAGGGPYPGNNLWDATQMCANFAYRTLTYQGFTKETIYYLSSDTDLDLDSNGIPDDVDSDVTNANLENAVTQWATEEPKADSLVVYLVDHGGEGTFRMSGTETLSATDLDSWLDTLQESISGKVIVVYDACHSGSFLPALIPPADKERIVIASASADEPAYFVTQGSVSFSNYFWTHIFNGLDVRDAFDLSNQAMGSPTEFQHPLADADGNGVGNEPGDMSLCRNVYIGNGTVIQGNAPVIGSMSPDQLVSGTSSALLHASGVTDDDGIARVWAIIRPPNYHQESSDRPCAGTAPDRSDACRRRPV